MSKKQSTPQKQARARPPVEEADLDELLRLLPLTAGRWRRPRGRSGIELWRRLRQASLGPRHARVLTQLALAGPLSVSELAARLDVTLTTASLMVTQLAEAGLVERSEDADDRRRTIVAIAPRYRPLLEAWLEDRAAPLRATLERLSEPERDAFLRALRILADELGPSACQSDH